MATKAKEVATTEVNRLLNKRSFNEKETGQLLVYSLMYTVYKTDKVDINKLLKKYQKAGAKFDAMSELFKNGAHETYRSLHVGLTFLINYNFAHDYKILYFESRIVQKLHDILADKESLQLDNSFHETILCYLEDWKNAIRLMLAYNELLKILEEIYELESLSECLKYFSTDYNLKLIKYYNEDVDKLINSGKYAKEDILKVFERIDVAELYPTKERIKKTKEHLKELGTSQRAIVEYKYYLLGYAIEMAGQGREQ